MGFETLIFYPNENKMDISADVFSVDSSEKVTRRVDMYNNKYDHESVPIETPTPSYTPTTSPTPSYTPTTSPTPSVTSTPVETPTPAPPPTTQTPSPTITHTASQTMTYTQSPTLSFTPTVTGTPQQTPTPSDSPVDIYDELARIYMRTNDKNESYASVEVYLKDDMPLEEIKLKLGTTDGRNLGDIMDWLAFDMNKKGNHYRMLGMEMTRFETSTWEYSSSENVLSIKPEYHTINKQQWTTVVRFKTHEKIIFLDEPLFTGFIQDVEQTVKIPIVPRGPQPSPTPTQLPYDEFVKVTTHQGYASVDILLRDITRIDS